LVHPLGRPSHASAVIPAVRSNDSSPKIAEARILVIFNDAIRSAQGGQIFPISSLSNQKSDKGLVDFKYLAATREATLVFSLSVQPQSQVQSGPQTAEVLHPHSHEPVQAIVLLLYK